MIHLIDQYFIDNGHYGRTWGDYRYTDIGLDLEDWENPVLHIYFKPTGNILRISPEEGYKLVVIDSFGMIRTLSYSLNWDLIYNASDGKWYYHSISENNIIDINTLDIQW
ncbi:MAG: hypothetical protein PHX63_06075 [Eubacteriales bacterium]|nr:hypothetical protein [Eubacteriales bacterium]